MSDTPLFQNTDEQEALYAPQQLPSDGAADGTTAGEGAVPLPLAAAGMDLSGGRASGVAHAGGTGGTAGGAGLAFGTDAAADATEDETGGRS